MIAVRRATPEDRPFIVSGWSSSYRTSTSAGFILMDDWPDVMHRQVERVLDRDETLALVASTEGVLCGFLVSEPDSTPPLVLYCFVKQPYRRHGIARQLFAAAQIDPSQRFDYACRSAVVSQLERSIPLAKFRPVTARFPRHERWSP